MKLINVFINQIKRDKKTRDRIFLITFIMALFILALVIKGEENNTTFIKDKNGYITQIVRSSNKRSEDYEFKLRITNGKEQEERSVKINKQARRDAKSSSEEIAQENKTIAKEAEISNIITDIELSDLKIIRLPSTLSDGSRLTWSLEEKGISNAFIIVFIYIVLVLLAIYSGVSKEGNSNGDLRKIIIRDLPRFTNQLMLMLNAGVILSDAFDYICNSYTLMGIDNQDSFHREMIAINDANKEHRISTAMLINRYAGKRNVKELLRISTILLENEKRGSDIIDNLNRESKYLWDDRKIIARERGKMIDTKMSYPMGLLLIILIIITMTPALLNL